MGESPTQATEDSYLDAKEHEKETQEKIKNAQDTLDEKQAILDKVYPQYAKGSYGFFEWLKENHPEITDIDYTLNIMYNSSLSHLIDPNKCDNELDAFNPTTLENMGATFDFIRECNQIRTELEGKSELYVSSVLMASSQMCALYSNEYGDHYGNTEYMRSEDGILHSLLYNSLGENFAGISKDPFLGWYNFEKENYLYYKKYGVRKENDTGKYGHYGNIIRKYETKDGVGIVGYACSGYGSNSAGQMTHLIQFASPGIPTVYYPIQVDQYEALFNEYLATMNYFEKRDARNQAKKELEAIQKTSAEGVQKVVDEKQKAYDDAYKIYKAADEKRIEAENELQSANKRIEELNIAFETAEKEAQTASNAYHDFIKAQEEQTQLNEQAKNYEESLKEAEAQKEEPERIYNETTEALENARNEKDVAAEKYYAINKTAFSTVIKGGTGIIDDEVNAYLTAKEKYTVALNAYNTAVENAQKAQETVDKALEEYNNAASEYEKEKEIWLFRGNGG